MSIKYDCGSTLPRRGICDPTCSTCDNYSTGCLGYRFFLTPDPSVTFDCKHPSSRTHIHRVQDVCFSGRAVIVLNQGMLIRSSANVMSDLKRHVCAAVDNERRGRAGARVE